MLKTIKLTFLAAVLAVTTVNTTNAAFPKEKATSSVTTTTAVAQEASVTKVSEVKNELSNLKKATANNYYAGGSKSKIVAALLAFFLGSLGIHSFYMGQKKKGLIQLGLSVVGIILTVVGIAGAVSSTSTGTVAVPTLAIIGYLLIVGVAIWAFIDLIRILTGGLAPEEGFDD
jgi:TM2 domain-containing membrane protein YozV